MKHRTAFYRMAVMADLGLPFGMSAKVRASRMSRRQYIFALETMLWEAAKNPSTIPHSVVIGWLLLDLLWKEAHP